MVSSAHTELAQRLAADAIVELFQLDPSSLNLGLSTLFFTPGTIGSAPIVYQGVTYTPFPIQLTGLERTSQGTQPRPRLSVSNIGGLIAGMVIAGRDLVGAKLVYLRTFARFLDGQPQADADAHWGPTTFVVDRKSTHSKTVIEWELATPLDNKALKIPGWLALKNSCRQDYRRWLGSAFDYSKATCPYTGSFYFNLQGASTANPSEDACGKRLSDCRKRFGTNAELPFMGFPGMKRL